MSKKYSSDNEMQNLFEGFRRSLNENVVNESMEEYSMRKKEYQERIAAGMNYEYRRVERAGKHTISFIQPDKGNGYEYVRLEFGIGGKGQPPSDAERGVRDMGYSWSSLASAANDGDEKAIKILHQYGTSSANVLEEGIMDRFKKGVSKVKQAVGMGKQKSAPAAEEPKKQTSVRDIEGGRDKLSPEEYLEKMRSRDTRYYQIEDLLNDMRVAASGGDGFIEKDISEPYAKELLKTFSKMNVLQFFKVVD